MGWRHQEYSSMKLSGCRDQICSSAKHSIPQVFMIRSMTIFLSSDALDTLNSDRRWLVVNGIKAKRERASFSPTKNDRASTFAARQHSVRFLSSNHSHSFLH